MLTHASLIADAAGTGMLLEEFQPGDRHISYLPLAHIYERNNLTVGGGGWGVGGGGQGGGGGWVGGRRRGPLAPPAAGPGVSTKPIAAPARPGASTHPASPACPSLPPPRWSSTWAAPSASTPATCRSCWTTCWCGRGGGAGGGEGWGVGGWERGGGGRRGRAPGANAGTFEHAARPSAYSHHHLNPPSPRQPNHLAYPSRPPPTPSPPGPQAAHLCERPPPVEPHLRPGDGGGARRQPAGARAVRAGEWEAGGGGGVGGLGVGWLQGRRGRVQRRLGRNPAGGGHMADPPPPPAPGVSLQEGGAGGGRPERRALGVAVGPPRVLKDQGQAGGRGQVHDHGCGGAPGGARGRRGRRRRRGRRGCGRNGTGQGWQMLLPYPPPGLKRSPPCPNPSPHPPPPLNTPPKARPPSAPRS
jgi:hypothetical protein